MALPRPSCRSASYPTPSVKESTPHAAIIFGFMMGLNIVGSIGAGIHSDRFSHKNLLAMGYFRRGADYLLLLVVPSSLSLQVFAAVAGFSWIATAPLTADVYGLRALGIIFGVSFLFHSLGSFLSIVLAGLLFDPTGYILCPSSSPDFSCFRLHSPLTPSGSASIRFATSNHRPPALPPSRDSHYVFLLLLVTAACVSGRRL